MSSNNIIPFFNKIVEKNDIKTIVVGQPYKKIIVHHLLKRNFKIIDVLKNKFPNISLERYNERYTSVIAKVIIQSGISKSKRRDKSLVDKIRLLSFFNHI